MNRIPVVTKNLLAINVVMFLAAERWGVNLNNTLGLYPFMSNEFYPFQLVTYMFMHSGVAHIFFNMFALYMFGRTLEYVWGPKRFLIFYIVAGIGAGLCQEVVGFLRYSSIVSDMSPDAVSVVLKEGADALSRHMNFVDAILLGFGMLFPNERMFVFPLPFPIKAKYFVVGYVVLEVYLGISGARDGVAHFAHLGGVLFGLLLILHWRKKGQIGGPYV